MITSWTIALYKTCNPLSLTPLAHVLPSGSPLSGGRGEGTATPGPSSCEPFCFHVTALSSGLLDVQTLSAFGRVGVYISIYRRGLLRLYIAAKSRLHDCKLMQSANVRDHPHNSADIHSILLPGHNYMVTLFKAAPSLINLISDMSSVQRYSQK